jgi:hypothetical protein
MSELARKASLPITLPVLSQGRLLGIGKDSGFIYSRLLDMSGNRLTAFLDCSLA